MNTLSWFLYFADVLVNVRHLFSLLAFLGTTVYLFVVCYFLIGLEKKPPLWPALVLSMLTLIAASIPSKNTMYAMAASEMGQKVLETPVATKAMQALENWIDSQLKGK